MSTAEFDWVNETLSKARATAQDLQPWPDYFEFKTEELKTILGFCEFSSAHSILEIGCGNGFTSYLLSRRAGRVEAFDLPVKDPASHSVGVHMAGKLSARMGVGNMTVTGGSVIDIPYRDGSFDVIFSQYMLQYVKDKDRALAEMRRVLADKGTIVTIVPNFTERIFVPLIKFEYVISAVMARMTMNSPSVEGKTIDHNIEISASHSASKISRVLSNYCLLRPDGAYRSYLEEMLRHRSASWKRLFEENGFKVLRTFSTQMLPLGLFVFLGNQGMRLLSGKIHSLTRAIGGLPLLRDMGYSLGIVAVKRQSA